MSDISITAVATLYNKTEAPSGETVSLAFNADYQDERNKEWSQYTPALSLSMNVLTSVADEFELGETYLLTFQKKVA